MPENEVVLSIALIAEKHLIDCGIQVVLTRRTNDVMLSNRERAEIANQSGSDLCVRLHCNGVRSLFRWVAFWRRGILTLVPPPHAVASDIYEASLRAGKIIHKHILSATGFPDCGLKIREDLTGFNWSTIPVVLLELGYLTNPIEEALLVNLSFQERLAAAIAAGVEEAFHDS
jgi:N-acetylmuramoyl-L-alanine amidase